MSRIGRLPIAVPSGVDVAIEESVVTVKGPKGTLTHTVADPIVVERAAGAPWAAAYIDGILRVNPSFVYMAAAPAAP